MGGLKFDLREVLPERTVGKVAFLVEDAPAVARGGQRAASDRFEEVFQRHQRIVRNRSRIQLARADARVPQQWDADLRNAESELEASKADLDRAQAVLAAANAPALAAGGLAESLREALITRRATVLRGEASAFRDWPIQPVDQGDPFIAVEEARSVYAQLQAQRDAIVAAPRPREELLAEALAVIEDHAAGVPLRVSPRDRSGDPIGLTKALAISQVVNGPVVSQIGPLMVWLLRDVLIKRVTDLIQNADLGGEPIADATRKEALAEIDRRWLEAERFEEAIVLGAERRGIDLPRRKDASPLAVMEVQP